MRYQYDSVNNSTYIGATDHRNEPEQSSCRIPCLVLLPTILFAAFVGHVSTIAYIGTNRQESALMGEPKTIKNDPMKAQEYAEEKFKEHLLEPCQLAEEYYNNTSKEKDIMTSNGLDEKSAPPHPPSNGCHATILVFRHCEAGVAREHCGYMGNLRSEYIATLFGDSGRWPEPSYIFAMKAAERHNQYVKNWREIETVIPLSKKFNVDIDDSYGYPEKKKFEKHLFKMLMTGELCGKVAVISWKHHDMPHFAHTMGCGPENGCPMMYGENDYESVWQLSYSYHKERYAPYAVDDLTPHGLKKHRPWGNYPQWFVYGSVQTEDFDPLAFKKVNADLIDSFDKNY